MRRFLYGLGVVAALAVGGVAFGDTAQHMLPAAGVATLDAPAKTKRFAHNPQPSDVEIMLDNDLGSGVHIGDGLFLTAAHVIDHPSKRLDIRLRDKSIRPAEVLWASKQYDIALLSADGKDIDASKLACRDAKVGEPISSIGNPLGVDSVLAFGHVAGEARRIGDIKTVFVMDMTVVMGQSGGPVFDDKDEIIGINSMVMVAPLDVPDHPGARVPTLVGYSYAVPSSVICKLLARTA